MPFPSGYIDTGKDGNVEIIPTGSSVTLTFGSPLVVGSHAGYDLVYYELPVTNPPEAVNGIMMDQVILQVSDGSNWYTILNWGNGFPNPNTNILNPFAVPPNPTDCAGEPDNCPIDGTLLFNGSGIAIDLDGPVLNGKTLLLHPHYRT